MNSVLFSHDSLYEGDCLSVRPLDGWMVTGIFLGPLGTTDAAYSALLIVVELKKKHFQGHLRIPRFPPGINAHKVSHCNQNPERLYQDNQVLMRLGK